MSLATTGAGSAAGASTGAGGAGGVSGEQAAASRARAATEMWSFMCKRVPSRHRLKNGTTTAEIDADAAISRPTTAMHEVYAAGQHPDQK
jgi:hypothetical protein